MPSRTRQCISTVSGSRVNSNGRIVSCPARTSLAPATNRSRSAAWSERNSTSRAADSGGSSRQCSGVPGIEWLATISAGATISSTALAPAATSSGTGSVALSIPSKWTHAVVVCGRSGIVSKTASETNPRVPSEPTSSRRKISTGVSASRKEQSR